MAFSFLRNRAVARSAYRSLVAGLLLWPALGLAAPTIVDKISVNVDQATLVRLPGKIATIVVGNPLIADVTADFVYALAAVDIRLCRRYSCRLL